MFLKYCNFLGFVFLLILNFNTTARAGEPPVTTNNRDPRFSTCYLDGLDIKNTKNINTSGSVPHNTTQQIFCKDGFGTHDKKSFTIRCADGIWHGIRDCLPHCDVSAILANEDVESIKNVQTGLMISEEVVSYDVNLYVNCALGRTVRNTGFDYYKTKCQPGGTVEPIFKCEIGHEPCKNEQVYSYSGAVIDHPTLITSDGEPVGARCLPGYNNIIVPECTNGTWSRLSAKCAKAGCDMDSALLDKDVLGGVPVAFSLTRPVSSLSYESFDGINNIYKLSNISLVGLYIQCISESSMRPAVLTCNKEEGQNGFWVIDQKCTPLASSCGPGTVIEDTGIDFASIDRSAMDGETVQVFLRDATSRTLSDADQVSSLCQKYTEYNDYELYYACKDGNVELLTSTQNTREVKCISENTALSVVRILGLNRLDDRL